MAAPSGSTEACAGLGSDGANGPKHKCCGWAFSDRLGPGEPASLPQEGRAAAVQCLRHLLSVHGHTCGESCVYIIAAVLKILLLVSSIISEYKKAYKRYSPMYLRKKSE